MSAENRLVIHTMKFSLGSWYQFGVRLIPKVLPRIKEDTYSEVNSHEKVFTLVDGVAIFVGIGLRVLFVEVEDAKTIRKIDPINAQPLSHGLVGGTKNHVLSYLLEEGSQANVQMLGIEYKSGSIIDRFRLDLAGSFGDRSNKKHKG